MKLDMTQIGKFSSLLIIILTITSCYNDVPKKEVMGIYVGNFENNKDTIKILNHNKYKRLIYSNSDKLIFENTGSWKYSNSSIRFENYLINNDGLKIKYEYNQLDLTNANLPIRKKVFSNNIQIVESFDEDLYFVKLPD